ARRRGPGPAGERRRGGCPCDAGRRMPGGDPGTVPGREEEHRMSMNVIEASGLGKRYGSTWALRECTLAVPAGHVAALVGPNGAGKSTRLSPGAGRGESTGGGMAVRAECA